MFLSCFSTRFCDSIPDVFCRNGKRRGDIGYCHIQLTPLIKRKALWEPGQRCERRWDTGVPQTQPKKVNHYGFLRRARINTRAYTHIWGGGKKACNKRKLFASCLWYGLMSGQEIKQQHPGYVTGSGSSMTVMKLKSDRDLTAYRQKREIQKLCHPFSPWLLKSKQVGEKPEYGTPNHKTDAHHCTQHIIKT